MRLLVIQVNFIMFTSVLSLGHSEFDSLVCNSAQLNAFHTRLSYVFKVFCISFPSTMYCYHILQIDILC